VLFDNFHENHNLGRVSVADGNSLHPAMMMTFSTLERFRISLLFLGTGYLSLVAAPFLAAREPSSLEQYYLELVNRARANPNGEVARLNAEVWGDTGSTVPANLNEGLAPGTISAAPKPPLAFDTRLIDSASDYSDRLLANEAFTHTFAGTSPKSRMTAAGFPFVPSWGTGENLALTTSNVDNPVDEERAEEHHLNLFIDGDVPGRGHRISIMDANFREVGIAIRADSDNDSFFGLPYTEDVVSTQNFAYSQGRIFVTGVIYFDTNVNALYDPGETAGILALEVRNGADTIVASGTSFASGGYSINLSGRPAGSYTLIARNENAEVESVLFNWNGTTNVKADIIDPAFTVPAVLQIPFQVDLSIGIDEQSFIGNDIFSATGAGQAIRAKTKTAGTVTWRAVVENDGSNDDVVRVTGSRTSRFFRVSYLRQDGGVLRNESAALVTGKSDALQTGEDQEFLIRLKPEKRALGTKKNYSFYLESRSLSDPSKSDRATGLLLNQTKRVKRR